MGSSKHPPAKTVSRTIDGNEAAAEIAYLWSQVSFIYPITPASPMAEFADAWANAGKKNLFGQVLQIQQMQSEAGAAGALHGALAAGAMCTTFTSSQGLLLMIPDMYKIAGELMPCVMHVAARAIAGQALSIFGDHSDVMAARSCGWAMLASHTVQECYDMALVAHVASLRASIPFCHFFDGFRLSHEVSKISTVAPDALLPLIDEEAIDRHHRRALNPSHPHQRGTNQGPDVYFQAQERSNSFYDATPAVVEAVMGEVSAIVGRRYGLFDYCGSPAATRVIVVMGGGSPVVEEAASYLRAEGEEVGVVKVRLFRPWSAEHFVRALPAGVQRIAVLDRCKDPAAPGEPLYLDVCTSLVSTPDAPRAQVVGGRFGLGSKDFTPGMAIAVFDNLKLDKPKNHFTVGLEDDVTFYSLPKGPRVRTVPAGTRQCLFWGMGSDGTVGANREAIKMIGENTDMYTQAYFSYDAHKSGGVTVSHVRFGPHPLTSQYLIEEADYVAVHSWPYMNKYDVLAALRPGGVLVINSPCAPTELGAALSPRVRRRLFGLQPEVWVIDAQSIAQQAGLGKRINMVMQTVFFQLSGALPVDQAITLLKGAIHRAFGKKGPAIVNANCAAVDAAAGGGAVRVAIPKEWAEAEDGPAGLPRDGSWPQKGQLAHGAPAPELEGTPWADTAAFVENVVVPMWSLEGDSLPVSAFVPGGLMPPGTTKYEKRSIALEIPRWRPDKCSQCNKCAFVCPHAAIRPFLVSGEELERGDCPSGFETRKAKGVGGLQYRIQVSPYDCTGCTLCVHACPDDALEMVPVGTEAPAQAANWDFAAGLPCRTGGFDRQSVKGSQFSPPLLEFSGACEGCGETPYVKLLTQLFGESMVVANATGCSSIWGGSAPSNPYTTNAEGMGPAWSNSLFEDNAEFGYGIFMATRTRRRALADRVTGAVGDASLPMSDATRAALRSWLRVRERRSECFAVSADVERRLEAEPAPRPPAVEAIWRERDILRKTSQWIIGGDGWAYDIDFGGLDHVLASGEDVNILVLDTEMYSNTGGQKSKATPLGAVAKFATGGNLRRKKDLGVMAMQYDDVYVASVCLGANPSQVVRALVEAESYNGPSLVLAYIPCILQGPRDGMGETLQEAKMAVDVGYWTLYRRDPRVTANDEHVPFTLDSPRVHGDLAAFLKREGRFQMLRRSRPDMADKLQKRLATDVTHHRELLQGLSETPQMHRQELLASFQRLSAGVAAAEGGGGALEEATVLYGSETGNAEGLAHYLASDLRARGVQRVVCRAANDLDLGELRACKILLMVVSTCGQGEWPANCEELWAQMGGGAEGGGGDAVLKGLRFAVFGLGDSSYSCFCKAAKGFDRRLGELGASRAHPLGFGDDQAPEGYEEGWAEWAPGLFEALSLPPPRLPPGPPAERYEVHLAAQESAAKPGPPALAPAPLVIERGAAAVPIVGVSRLTAEGYAHTTMLVEFDLSDHPDLHYEPGEALAVFPRNDPAAAAAFLEWVGLDPAAEVDASPAAGAVDGEGLTRTKPPVPPGTTALQVATDLLDLFGRPSRRFLEVLPRLVPEEGRAELEAVLGEGAPPGGTPESRSDLRARTATVAEVLRALPSARPQLTFARLLDLVPAIRPRLYSIASSQRRARTRLELCVSVAEWTTPSGEERKGACTGYLYSLLGRATREAPALAAVGVRPSGGLGMPARLDRPLVMAGLGAGVAPFRSVLEELRCLRAEGKQCGPAWLYFGARYKDSDYVFAEEWRQMLEEGTLAGHRTAFSRDQEQKIYVQHILAQDGARLWELLGPEGGGSFFFCGLGRSAPGDVRAAIEGAFRTAGGQTAEGAAVLVDQMVAEGRYVVESWS